MKKELVEKIDKMIDKKIFDLICPICEGKIKAGLWFSDMITLICNDCKINFNLHFENYKFIQIIQFTLPNTSIIQEGEEEIDEEIFTLSHGEWVKELD